MKRVFVAFTIVSFCMLVISILLSGIVHALPVDRYWSVLESPQLSTDANGFIGLKFIEDF
jgi:hypothetical protein